MGLIHLCIPGSWHHAWHGVGINECLRNDWRCWASTTHRERNEDRNRNQHREQRSYPRPPIPLTGSLWLATRSKDRPHF